MKKILITTAISFSFFANAQPSMAPVNLQKPEHYNIPLYFNPDDVGMKQVSYQLSWDLKSKDTLKLGSLILDGNSFIPAFFTKNSKLHPFAILGEPSKTDDMLFLTWPTSLIKYGTVEMIARDGSVLWTDSFDEKDFKIWQRQLQKFQQQISTEKQAENKIFFSSGIALKSLNSETLGKINSSFRFCLSQEDGKQRTMLCTPKHVVTKGEEGITLSRITEEVEARVLIDREEAPLIGQKNVEPKQLVSFFSETSSGLGYEFTTEVLPVKIFDVFKDTDGAVLLSGVDPVPVGAGVYESKNDEDTFWNRVGWQQTIGDLRNYWQMQLPKNKELSVPGKVGGLFVLKMDFKEIPTVEQRVWISNQDVKATYSEKKVLHLYHSEKQKIQSPNPDELTSIPDKTNELLWQFPAPRTLKYNISNIEILNEGTNPLKGSYEIYRGLSSELSGRFTAAVDNNLESIVLGEITYNKWFENLWGWDSSKWSHLRWGLSAKYLKSLNSVEVEDGTTTAQKSDINIMSANLKYRFNPGLWGRDETWGLLGGYSSLSIADVSTSVLGVGFFWARSMPKVFEDLFSYLPFMGYPIFMDMEAIYYPMSMDSKVSLGSSYLLSFHGKVLWTETFFGEGGFGLRSYSLQDKSSDINVDLSSFYLTIGLGMNF